MHYRWTYPLIALVFGCGAAQSREPTTAGAELIHPGEAHLENILQLTRGQGENAEAYWSFDGKELVFQSARPPFGCDQIFVMNADGTGTPARVSTGKGRTTCSYFLPGNDRILWSSTHEASPECPKTPDMSQGYVWPIYSEYEIFVSDRDGKNPVKLTDNQAYDAEATVCPRDGSIIFTSTRDGDLDLYRMDKDGKNVTRITRTIGYDGGAFFSADCQKIVWRASRPTGDAVKDYNRLLQQGLVRPSRLEIFVANADGSEAHQVTYLNAASFAPFFHPSGNRILFSTNYPEPRGREFDIYSIGVDGTGLERITTAPGFDGFPMFSPDGSRLVFASNRNQAREGQTDVYVARWTERAGGTRIEDPADRYRSDVAWLADDARQGRGVGTEGLNDAAGWLEKRFRELGVEGAFAGEFRQKLSVPVAVENGASFGLLLDEKIIPSTDFVAAGFSSNGVANGQVVDVGFGISAPKLGHDDYRGKKVKGRIAVMRRFVPTGAAFADDRANRQFSDLHYKAFVARERGATAVIFYDIPSKDEPEAPLPAVQLAPLQEVGIPVIMVKHAHLVRMPRKARVTVELVRVERPAFNIAGVIRAGASDRLPGQVVVGAHYDHLGMGDENSLEPGVAAVHNGADDNASGTAGLLEVARQLALHRDKLRRDVYLVAFTAEERGLLGSSHFVRHLPPGVSIEQTVAMLNMDMIGRLRDNQLDIIGGDTAREWRELVTPACQSARIGCDLSGSGYGPSDQTSFYAENVPVLHFFTGAHGDYHKTTDDTAAINAGGGVRVAAVVATVSATVANREQPLSFQRIAPELPAGDSRSFGASLGTIPDYAQGDDGKPGVLLSGVRPGGPADQAGIRGKDRLLKIGSTEVRTVQDLVYVLRQAKPGTSVEVEFERDGKPQRTRVTFAESKRQR